MAKMNAVVMDKHGGPDVLKYCSDVPVPTLRPNKVLVKMKASGINSADSAMRKGSLMNAVFKPPCTLGVDGAGIIEMVGNDVTKYKPGDRVYLVIGESGTYSEFVLADEGNVYPLHGNLSFKEGAVLGVPYFTAYRALVKRAKFEKGESVLIQGVSGQVGLACAQIARGLGASYIVGTAGTSEGQNIALKSGADVVINYRDDDFRGQLEEAFFDKQLDMIIEMNSDVNMDLDLDLIRPGGRIVIIGKRGQTKCDPAKVIAKESTIMGSGLKISTQEDRFATAAALYQAAEEGWLRPHVNKEYSLREAETAHRDMGNQRGAVGKSIFVM